jgi:hypothetical protein
MKEKKLKTYVIIIARKYPAHHPLKGNYTRFYGYIDDGTKIHTIRKNYPLWQKRILDIQLGQAVLELREWVGKPYRSKQRHLFTLTAKDGVGIQRYAFIPYKEALNATPEEIAKNDGLSFSAFQNWFRLLTNEDELCIIHFTPFRYNLVETNHDLLF